jgi:arylsulfatase A-like enzyme
MNILTAVAVSTVSSSPPHIVFFMADDLGHGNVNFNRATPVAEVTTPNMDSLVEIGRAHV